MTQVNCSQINRSAESLGCQEDELVAAQVEFEKIWQIESEVCDFLQPGLAQVDVLDGGVAAEEIRRKYLE